MQQVMEIIVGVALGYVSVFLIMFLFTQIGSMSVRFKNKSKKQKIEVFVFSEDEDPTNEKNFANFVIARTNWEECSGKMSKEETVNALENARNNMTFDFFNSPFYEKGILGLYNPKQFYSDILDKIHDEGKVKFKEEKTT